MYNMDMALSWWGLQLAGETDANSPVIMSCVKMALKEKVVVLNVMGFEGGIRLAGGLEPL